MGMVAPIIGAVASLAGSFLGKSAPTPPPAPPPVQQVDSKDADEREESEAAKIRAAKRRAAGQNMSGFLGQEESNKNKLLGQ